MWYIIAIVLCALTGFGIGLWLHYNRYAKKDYERFNCYIETHRRWILKNKEDRNEEDKLQADALLYSLRLLRKLIKLQRLFAPLSNRKRIAVTMQLLLRTFKLFKRTIMHAKTNTKKDSASSGCTHSLARSLGLSACPLSESPTYLTKLYNSNLYPDQAQKILSTVIPADRYYTNMTGTARTSKSGSDVIIGAYEFEKRAPRTY
jgi:hypothetical protein